MNSYPARELNGNVFMWHDPEMGEPDYELPDMAEYSDPKWVQWSLVRKDIKTVPKEIVDNIADKAHFPFVHGAAIAETRDPLTALGIQLDEMIPRRHVQDAGILAIAPVRQSTP